MNNQHATITTTRTEIPPTTRLGHVHYTVANLDRQIAFYRDILGFKLHWLQDRTAGLGAGKEDLLRLTELPDVRRVRGTTGLYHTAFLVPTQLDLAQLLRSIATTRTRIQGMTDHGTHHAIYLPDAEGNGVELAWDMPREQWPRTLDEMMARNRGLAPEQVFSAFTEETSNAKWHGLDAATIVGHVHLHVSDIAPARHFYEHILGFRIPLGFADSKNALTESAMFYAAGDYHHHVGTNVWQGVGAPPPPAEATGLRYYSIVLPTAADLDLIVRRIEETGLPLARTADGLLVHDPAHNGIMLTSEKP